MARIVARVAIIPISFENATDQHVTIVGAGFTSHVGKKQTISLNPPPSVADSWEKVIR